MKTNFKKIATIVLSIFFISTIGYAQTEIQEPLAGVKNTKEFKTIDLIYMDKDLSIFTNLLVRSGLDVSLSMVDSSHTLFVPSNEAFMDMSMEDFAELTNPKNKEKLVAFVNRHFTGTMILSNQLKGNKALDWEGDERIEISNFGNQVTVGGATIVAADIKSANGIIHVVNDVITYTEKN